MNKKLLALAIGAAAVLPMTAAAASSIYGKVNVTLQNVDNGTLDQWQLESNASRLGVKGDIKISDTLKGLYQAEYQIDVDNGAAASSSVRNAAGTGTTTVNQPFSQRNIFAGFNGEFGTIRFGRIDTPLKDAQGKIDQFNDLDGDIGKLIGGETRADNIIYYTSPTLGGAMKINFAIMPGENTNVDGVAGNETGLADSLSASVVYEKDALYAALAVDQSMPLGGFSPDTMNRVDIVRLAGGWKSDTLELGLIFQTTEDTVSGGEDVGGVLGAAWKTGNWKLKAQYGDNDNATTLLAVGADYKMAKTTTLFGYFANVETEAGQTNAGEKTTIAFGAEHGF